MRMLIVLVPVLASLLFSQTNAPTVRKVPVTPTMATAGKDMFRQYCAACHGMSGKGDGPAAASFKKAPRDLTRLAHDNGGKYPADHVAAILAMQDCCVHGSKDMPVWGPVLSSVSHNEAELHQRIANLVNYIETLQAH